MIRNILILRVAFLVFVCYLASGNEPTEEIIPLKEGNWWKYSIVISRGGRVYKSDTLTLRIESKKEIHDSYWYKFSINTNLQFIQNMSNMYISNKADGLWLLNFIDSLVQAQHSILLFQYPTFIGDENNRINKQHDIVLKTINIFKTTLTVADGEYSCVEYLTTGVEDTHYFTCPGIGLVKLTENAMKKAEGSNKAEKSDRSVIITLIDYKIN